MKPELLKNKLIRFDSKSLFEKKDIKSAVEWLKEQIKGTNCLSFNEDSNDAQLDEEKIIKRIDEAFEDVVEKH